MPKLIIHSGSEQGERENEGFVRAAACGKAMEQVRATLCQFNIPQVEYCLLFQTQRDFMQTNYWRKKYNRKRLDYLSKELPKKISHLKKPSQEEEIWWVSKMKKPLSWKRWYE
jgi:hypothetical protein